MITPETYEMFFELVKEKYEEDKINPGSAIARISTTLGESEDVVKKFLAGTTHKNDLMMLSRFADYYGISNNWVITNMQGYDKVKMEKEIEETSDDIIDNLNPETDIELDSQYIKTYCNPFGENEISQYGNYILSKDYRIAIDTKKSVNYIHENKLSLPCLNNNIMVIGPSGSGKTRNFIEPNVLQAETSMLITDVNRKLYDKYTEYLQKKGYKVKRFDLYNPEKSCNYNPFKYIHSDKDIECLIDTFMEITSNKISENPFWKNSEKALLQAIVAYLHYYTPKEKQNFSNVMRLLRAAEINENDDTAKSPLDLLFDEAEEKDPDGFPIKQYKTFKMAAGKTAKSTLVSCAVRLQAFNLEDVADLTDTDDMDLDSICDEKTALFICLSPYDTTINFIYDILITQLISLLYENNKGETDRKLNHVTFMLDEFQSLYIPQMSYYIATCRMNKISIHICLSSFTQLKALYEAECECIAANCDIKMCFGLSDQESAVFFRNAFGLTCYTKVQKKKIQEYMDSLKYLNQDECVIVAKSFALRDKKYNIKTHPDYREEEL